MPFQHLIGNEPVKQMLSRMIARQMVGHSFLFSGPAGIGKAKFAYAFASAILCADDPTGAHRIKLDAGNHPDIHWYRPEGKVGQHSIDSLRDLSHQVHLYPNEAKRKVFILQDADRMRRVSANALLKTFEEPSPDTIIILISDNPSALLPTVLSRCRRINFHRVPDSEIVQLLQRDRGLNEAEARQLAHEANGSIAKALRLVQGGRDPHREALLNLLAHGPVARYGDLQQFVKGVTDQIEAKLKAQEKEARDELLANAKERFTAVQVAEVEKEIAGMLASELRREAKQLYTVLLDWARDVDLVRSGASREFLLHADVAEQVEKASARKGIPTPQQAMQYVDDALVALDRSTQLSSSFEGLLIKTGLF